MLKLGLESGDQEVLNRMQKGINLELAAKVLENLQDVGISTYVYLLFGTPSEGPEEAERTLSFVEKHHQAISFLNLAIFNLPACSQEVSNLEAADFYEGDLSIYRNFIHPKGWNRGEVRRFLDTTFKRSPENCCYPSPRSTVFHLKPCTIYDGYDKGAVPFKMTVQMNEPL